MILLTQNCSNCYCSVFNDLSTNFININCHYKDAYVVHTGKVCEISKCTYPSQVSSIWVNFLIRTGMKDLQVLT